MAEYAKTKSGYINGYGYRKVWSDELKKSVNEHLVFRLLRSGYISYDKKRNTLIEDLLWKKLEK